MRTGKFLHKIDNKRLIRAIEEAELKTSGEIRVCVSRKPSDDAVKEAAKQFTILGMEKTQDRNGILFFVAPSSNAFAVMGDKGIHERCGQEFWDSLAAEMTDLFKAGDFTTGLVRGVEKAGALLSEFFPRKSDDRNELPNEIA